MSALPILKAYLLIQGLLLLCYFFFTTLQTLTGLAGSTGLARFRIGHQQWIRIARALLLVSILTPAALTFLPDETIPALKLSAFHPAPEGDESLSSSSTRSTPIQALSPTRHQQETPKSTRFQNALTWVSTPHGTITLFLFLFLGITAATARTLRSLLRLRSTLLHAVSLRSVGTIRVVVSEEISIPFSAWLGRIHWVALPFSLLERSRDLKLALRHELQHHRQGDTRWALAMELLSCLLFPSPGLLLWKKRIHELQEFSCDAALLGQRGVSLHEYASCLVRVAETALESRQMHAGTTCMAAAFKNPFYAKSFLRRRIEMFTHHQLPNTRKWVGIGIGTAAIACTMTVALGADQLLRKEPQKPNPGTPSMDPAIQTIADHALKDAVRSQNAKRGFAIVADPGSGKILAVAHVDSTGKLPENWALSQPLEPASLMKTLVAAQAIEAGLTTPEESHSCENGNYRYGGRVFHDWKTKGWRELSTTDTIAFSSNICTMKMAEKVGAEGLRSMLTRFGFGPEGTAKSFPLARAGVLPNWDTGKDSELIPAVSAGYGFQATPIELLQAYGAIANGGNLLMPKSADDSSAPQIIRRVLSSESAEKTKEILRQVVLKGTAKGSASSTRYSTAGKTATSHIPDLTQWELVEGKKKGNFAGFVGFAPVKSPRIEVYVGILDPNSADSSGAHGSAHAAPVFKRIIEEVLDHLKVAPDLG